MYFIAYMYKTYIKVKNVMCRTIKCGCPSGKTPRFLQPCILLLLHQKSSYGYELMENLKNNNFLETTPDVGAIYRILRKLENQEFVKSSWITKEKGAAKRTYIITTKGKKLLDDWAESIFAKVNSLNRFLSGYKKLKRRVTDGSRSS
jgi:PadR family transcriptional regulator, regulatory protein PadR